MVRFKKYIEKDILLENARNADTVKSFGITPHYVPDTPEEFEEFEFVTDFDGRTVSIGVSVQSGKIKRILVGLVILQWRVGIATCVLVTKYGTTA